MVVLDTDHLSVLEWAGSAESKRLLGRLSHLPQHEVSATIISFEEQTRGWLAVLAKARSMGQQIDAYRRLKKQMDNYRAILVREFDENAAVEFQRLVRLRLRIETLDLKIAAVALSHGATLLSRNLADFRKVPGLHVEDWTR